jgi:acetyl esterase/lipase
MVSISPRFRLVSLVLGCIVAWPALAAAQTVPAGKSRLFLWEGRRAPTTRTDTAYGPTDSVKNSWLLYYAPTVAANGTTVIVIPGGGYDNLSPWTSEGTPAATKLNAFGISVFILRYRVKPFMHPVQMWDVQRAVRWVRAHAAEYGLNPNRIGVLGFSAGGHVASMAATHFDSGLLDSNATNGPHWHNVPKDSIDRVSSRPDFQGLVYAMTTMVQYKPGTTSAFAYKPGRDLYIGTNPSTTLVDYTSNEKQVSPQTPPAWMNWGTADATVDTLNSAAYRDSLISKGLPVKTLVIAGGGHDPTQTFRADSLRTWLDSKGYLTSIRPARPRRAIPAEAWVGPGRALDALGRVGDRPTGIPLKISPATPDTRKN